MEFGDVIRKRRMVRAFTTDPLDPGLAQRLLTAANRAPSAGFSQGYALLVLDQPEQLRRFWDVLSAEEPPSGAPDFDPVTNAPLVIVPMSCKDSYLDRYAQQDKGWADRDESRWPVPYWDIDTGFIALLMLLAAVDEGLGALFFGIPPALIPAMRAEFGVPDAYLPIGAVAVGHPDPDRDQGGSSRVIKRRALDELVHYGRW
jgi:nitroreductase